jgi:ankyrin repeat protein
MDSNNLYLELNLFLDPAITDPDKLNAELTMKIAEWNKLVNVSTKFKHFVQIARAWQKNRSNYNLTKLAAEARSCREQKGKEAVLVYEDDGVLDISEYNELLKEFSPFFKESTIKSWLRLEVSQSFIPLEPEYLPEVRKKILSKIEMDEIAGDLKIILGNEKASLYDLIEVVPTSDLKTIQKKRQSKYDTAFKKPKSGSDSAKVDTEIRLLGKAKIIFDAEVSRQGYDIALRRRPFDELIDTKFKRRTIKGRITYEDYQKSIYELLEKDFSQQEAEWYVYEFYCKTCKFPQPHPQSQQQSQPQSTSSTTPKQNIGFFETLGQIIQSTVTKYTSTLTPEIDIFEAVKQGDLATVKQWLQINPKLIRTKDDNGTTPFHWATEKKSNIDILEYLISKGADVNAKNNDGFTPLHWAVNFTSDVEVIQYLISQKADVNTRDNNGWTPLHVAARVGGAKILEYLIAQGADANAKDYNGYEPLYLANTEEKKQIIINCITPKINIFEAVKQSDMATTKQWLQIKPKLIRAKNNNGNTLLHWAVCFNANLEIIKYLISQNADINAQNNGGTTPLHWAASRPTSVEVLQYLISQKANINIEDNNGCKPFDVANTDEKKKILQENTNPQNISIVGGVVFIVVALVLIFALLVLMMYGK